MRGIIKNLIFLVIILILSYRSIQPILEPGFFPMHDDTQPARIFEMSKALSYGQFPVRWVPDLGYGFGYPIFNFYAPLPYYLGAILNLLGVEILLATKIVFIIGVLLAGLTMFILVKEISTWISGTVASVLYVYAPYHAVLIYVRGAVGELYAYALLPILVLGVYNLLSCKKEKGLQIIKKRKRAVVLTAVSLAGILLSHNILGMITIYFLLLLFLLNIVYIYFKKKLETNLKLLFISLIIALGLSAFFTLPAVFEKNYTKVTELTQGGSDFHHHFVYLDQMWNSTWGFGGSASGRADGMSLKIGKLHLILGLLSIAALIYLYKRRLISKNLFFFYNISLFLFLISVFLMLEQSLIVWEHLPGFSFIQYPWRFLNYSLLGLSIFSSVSFSLLSKAKQLILALLIIIIAYWLNIKYFTPKEILSVTAADYTSNDNLRFRISKISDEYMPKEFQTPTSAADIAWRGLPENPGITVKDLENTPTKKMFEVKSSQESYIFSNIAYFPGWQATIDGKDTKIINIGGKISLVIPSGVHILVFNLINTPVRVFSNTLSLLSLFLLIYIALIKYKTLNEKIFS